MVTAPHQTRAETLGAVRERLIAAGIDPASAATEAELLMLHALQLSRADFWMAPRATLVEEEATKLQDLVARRESRVPLQLLTGSVDFHGVTLMVAPGVFIPRPETEVLVEVVLEKLRASGSAARPGRLLDLGTGTGAIAVALLRALPEWTGVAVDQSPAAVALAARNAEANGLAGRLQVMETDAFGADPATGTPTAGGTPTAAGPPAALPPGRYDLVISNPPYIPTWSIETVMPEVRDHDPRKALDGGPDGLDAYRSIARFMGHLPLNTPDNALLALEIGEDQADTVLGLPEWKAMMRENPGETEVHLDLAGRKRVLLATWRGGVHGHQREEHRGGQPAEEQDPKHG